MGPTPPAWAGVAGRGHGRGLLGVGVGVGVGCWAWAWAAGRRLLGVGVCVGCWAWAGAASLLGGAGCELLGGKGWLCLAVAAGWNFRRKPTKHTMRFFLSGGSLLNGMF